MSRYSDSGSRIQNDVPVKLWNGSRFTLRQIKSPTNHSPARPGAEGLISGLSTSES